MNRDELLEVCFGRSDLPEGIAIDVLDEAQENVLSHIDLFYRRVLIRQSPTGSFGVQSASETLTVAAIANVCTDPVVRGQGFASANLERAHRDAAAHLSVRFAALFAGADVQPFYERFGYFHPVGAADPHFLVCPLPYTLVVGFSESGEEILEDGRDEWPAGRIDTRGTW